MSSIVVIDDDVAIRALLREALAWDGFEVKEASTGKEGLRLCHEISVSLVITDILMSDMDGVEIIRMLRHSCPQTKIVAISGGFQWSGPCLLDVAKRLGADLAYSKPFDVRPFLEDIRELSG